MPDRPNVQQEAAVGRRGTSVVLAAGAGCGKTSVLTRRYLSHLRDDGAAVSEVTAITFTERAAREMRGRIRAAVAAEVAAAPGSAWERHRRDLDAAPIDTIHGYCGRLLRRFPTDRLPSGFRVFDEPQAASLRTEAVRAELHRLLVDPGPAGDDLRELAVLFGWAATAAAVEELLLDPDRPGWQRWADSSPTDRAGDWLRAQTAGRAGWVEYLVAAGGEFASAVRTLVALPLTGPAAERVGGVLADLRALPTAPDLLAAAEAVKERAKVQPLGRGDWAPADVKTAVKDAFQAVRDAVPAKLLPFADAGTGWDLAAGVGQRFLRVALHAEAAYAATKRRHGGADFHDLLVQARDLLRDDADARRQVQAGTRFLLVDEFQDTDPVQMELVRSVCGDHLHAGTLFAVGDVKQSIYRFRGAEVELFRGLEAETPEAGRLTLSTNYRSQPGVIRFVNALSAGRLPGYVPLDPQAPQAPGATNVEFVWAVPTSPDSREPVESVRAREADALARRIVRLLDDPAGRVWVRDGGFRRVRAGDVTLLFRAMSQVGIYEAALRRHGLDFYVVGGRAYFAQQEVYDLHNLLTAVENPHDGPALAGALRSPAGGLSDDALHLLAVHRDGLWAGLHDDATFDTLGPDRACAERCRRLFDGWRGLKDRLPIAGLLDRVFADCGFDAATQFEPLADRKLANLWKLHDLARGFDRDGLPLAAFAARLGESVAAQPREEEAATVPELADDVVRLMSVHKAKGLEFPVVIVPDLGAAGGGDRHPVARWDRRLGCVVRLPGDIDPADGDEEPFPDGPHRLGRCLDEVADWQEGLRVLYVACTRARDLLILSAGLTAEPVRPAPGVLPVPPPRASSHWLLALAERFDLLTGACVLPDGPRATVRLVTPTADEPRGRQTVDEPPPDPLPVVPVPFSLPPIVSVAALQALTAGDQLPTIAAEPEPTPVERLVRRVLGRWDLADRDGWQPLLADALADGPTPDAATRDELPAIFDRLAGRPRQVLLGMGEVRRRVELLFEPGVVAGDCLLQLPPGPAPALSGWVDVLARDAAGWHLLQLHLRERPGRHPWADAKPWLALLAAAARQALGGVVRTVGLIDGLTGEVHSADARRLSPAAGLGLVGVTLRGWVERSEGERPV